MDSGIYIADPELRTKFDNLGMKMRDWWKLAKGLTFNEYTAALLDYHEREHEALPRCNNPFCMCIYGTGGKCWTSKPCRQKETQA